MITMSSRASNPCCDLLQLEDARKDADRDIHRSSARNVGRLKTIARQTSKTLDSAKNLLHGPDMHADGPPATRACDVPWTRCCNQPSPLESVIN
jgi:hypothetical protein